MKLLARIRWKYLLGVFKLRRIVNRWHGSRRLDYQPKELWIGTTTIREYETRARSVHKEPETVAWIEGLPEHEVVYDIGANIGAYSLIAASLGHTIVAFEPAPQNYAALHENATRNGLDHAITILPFVLRDTDGSIDQFPIREYSRGATDTFLAGRAEGPGVKNLPVMTLDAAVEAFQLPLPTAIKIDVDGGEFAVLSGAEEVLNKKIVRTVLVETQGELKKEVQMFLTQKGFMVSSSHQRGQTAENIIFVRS